MANDFKQRFDAACANLDMRTLNDERLAKFLALNCIIHWNEVFSQINPANAKMVKEQVREEYRYVRDRFVNYLPHFPRSNNLLDETESDLQFFKDDFPKPSGP